MRKKKIIEVYKIRRLKVKGECTLRMVIATANCKKVGSLKSIVKQQLRQRLLFHEAQLHCGTYCLRFNGDQ